MTKPESVRVLKRSVVLILIVLVTSGMMSTCDKHPDAPTMKYRPRKYATDHRAGQVYAIVGRDKDGNPIYETCDVNQPCFDEFVAHKAKELSRAEKEIIDLTWMCEKWKK